MKFDDLDARMRIFETSHDHCVLPGLFMVARLDGRGFTRLTKELCEFEAPFDERFRDAMAETVEHLMDCGCRIVFGYTESDEISLLFHQGENAFGRKLRKLNSILAGEASAMLSLRLGRVASFDCRISQLPAPREVIDYFRWRNEDAHRNALNAHCYWALRKEGRTAKDADAQLLHQTIAEKNEFLFQRQINFNDLPSWQKRGIGVIWEVFQKNAVNKKTGEAATAERRRLKRIFDLPMKDEYSQFIAQIVSESGV
jgi:tRNA(His) guanylyltransferase